MNGQCWCWCWENQIANAENISESFYDYIGDWGHRDKHGNNIVYTNHPNHNLQIQWQNQELYYLFRNDCFTTSTILLLGRASIYHMCHYNTLHSAIVEIFLSIQLFCDRKMDMQMYLLFIFCGLVYACNSTTVGKSMKLEDCTRMQFIPVPSEKQHPNPHGWDACRIN